MSLISAPHATTQRTASGVNEPQLTLPTASSLMVTGTLLTSDVRKVTSHTAKASSVKAKDAISGP